MLRISGPEVVQHNYRFGIGIPIYDGAGSRIRTDDLLITNQLLYQLSYAGFYEGKYSPMRLLRIAFYTPFLYGEV